MGRAKRIEIICQTDIDAILVDSRTSENAATNIQAIDADLFNRIKLLSSKPLIIAGGIIALAARFSSTNCSALRSFCNFYFFAL